MGRNLPSSESDLPKPPVKQKRSKKKTRESGQKNKRTHSKEGTQQGEKNSRGELSQDVREGTYSGQDMVSLMPPIAEIALTVL